MQQKVTVCAPKEYQHGHYCCRLLKPCVGPRVLNIADLQGLAGSRIGNAGAAVMYEPCMTCIAHHAPSCTPCVPLQVYKLQLAVVKTHVHAGRSSLSMVNALVFILQVTDLTALVLMLQQPFGPLSSGPLCSHRCCFRQELHESCPC